MATTHSQSVYIKFAANNMTSYVNTHTYEKNPTIHDITGYGSANQSNKGGLKKGTFACGGIYDDTDTTGPGAYFRGAEASTVAVEYGPEGNATGAPKLSFSVVIGKYNESAKVDDMVMWSIDCTITGAVTESTYA